MSANCSDSEPTARIVQSAPAELCPKGRFTVYFVLAALVSLHLFVCSALSVAGLAGNDVSDLLSCLWIGTMLFQPALVACWFVLGMGRNLFRLATSLILMISFTVAHMWGASWNEGGALSIYDLISGVIFPGIFLTLSILLCVLRIRNWRLMSPLVDKETEPSHTTFTTAHLMCFIAVASLPLTLFGYLIRRVTMIDSTGWMGSVAGGFATAAVTAMVTAPLLIALLGTVLATVHRNRFLIALFVILALLTVAAAGVTVAIGMPFSDTLQLLQIVTGYCGAAAVSFWVMKCCGYRLTTNRCARVQVATTRNFLSPRYRSALLPLSVLGVMFVVLLLPAWHLVKYRRARAHAPEFEWQRRGVSVIVEDGQVTSAQILSGGVHRDAISNELLEDLSKAPNLRHLEVPKSSITDEQLELIGRASNLETLDLSRTSISDTGIQHLANLGKLRRLTLPGSQVTAEGIQQLKLALPDCDIRAGTEKRDRSN